MNSVTNKIEKMIGNIDNSSSYIDTEISELRNDTREFSGKVVRSVERFSENIAKLRENKNLVNN
jgi:hypothetical protein